MPYFYHAEEFLVSARFVSLLLITRAEGAEYTAY